MPVDTRRVNGPNNTISLSNFIRTSEPEQLIDEKGVRADGRKWDEIRPLYLKAGVVQQANGSAYLEASGTKVIVAVYGPRDNPKKHDFSSTGLLTCHLSYAQFSRKERIRDIDDVQSKENANLICQSLRRAVCLESYPKAIIDVFINILEENGTTLSYAIMAASIALADAGIQMLDIVTSCSLVYNEELSLLDPKNSELQHPSMYGRLTVAYLPSLNQVSGLVKDGEQDVDETIRAISTCIEGCLRVHSVMKECLVKATMDEEG